MLSLTDHSMFMEAGIVPVSGHSCFVGEIKDITMYGRIRLEVADINSDRTPTPGLVVIYYIDADETNAFQSKFRIGHTIVIIDPPRPKTFLDGTWGLRVETTTTTKVIPARYLKLLELEEYIHADHSKCDQCLSLPEEGKPLQRCTTCKTATYDKKACQEQHWAVHKKECKAIAGLREVLDKEEELEAQNKEPLFWS